MTRGRRKNKRNPERTSQTKRREGSGKYPARRTNVNDEFSRIGIDMTREQLCHAHTLLQFLYSKFIIMKNDLYQIKAKKKDNDDNTVIVQQGTARYT